MAKGRITRTARRAVPLRLLSFLFTMYRRASALCMQRTTSTARLTGTATAAGQIHRPTQSSRSRVRLSIPRISLVSTSIIVMVACKAPSIPASKEHCRSNRQLYRMLQVERFFRQCRMLLRQSRTLLRHCCWYGGGLNESEILAVANASRISSSLARRRSLYDKYLRACRWSLLHYPHTILSTIVFPTFGSAHHARWERYCVAYILQIRTKNLLRSLKMIPLSTVDITYDIPLVFCSHVSSLYGLLIYVQVK